MDADGGSERWGGDIDFNEWSSTEPAGDGPRWESTPPSRWTGKRIGWVIGGALIATLLGVGGVLGVLALIGDDSAPGDTVSPGASGDPSVASDAPPAVAPDDLEWFAIDGTLGFVQRIATASDGSVYALSTAPGAGFDVWPPVRAIYHTVDGEAWDFAILAEDISGSDMAISGDTIYLIGTAPGLGGFGDPPVVVINSSNDGGATWEQQSLPTVATPPEVPTEGWTDTSMHVAASSNGLVAVVQTNFWIDYWSLVPQEFLTEFNDIVATETGVDIVDYSIFNQLEEECAAAGGFGDEFGEEAAEDMPEPCRQLMEGDLEPEVVNSLTWEDLGVDGGQPSFSEIFVSPDGVVWEAVDSPLDPTQRLGGLFSTGRGYIATQWGRFGGNNLWISDDGRTWEPAEGFPALDWVAAAGSVGGHDVVLGSQLGKAVALWSDGAGSWESVDIAAQVEEVPGGQNTWLSAGAVGPLGVVAVIQSEGEGGPGTPGLLHGTARDEWSWIPLGDLVGQGWGYSDWVAVGTDYVLARYVEEGRQGPINLQLIGTEK